MADAPKKSRPHLQRLSMRQAQETAVFAAFYDEFDGTQAAASTPAKVVKFSGGIVAFHFFADLAIKNL